MSTELRIHLLGGLRIFQNNAPLTNFISSKVPALLAYLAVTRRAHSRERLAALLWGEMPDADAKNNLRQALSNLRKYCEPYLLITRNEVQFNWEVACFLDVEAFVEQLEIGDLHAAAALYQGDFLAGFRVREAPDFEEWMLAQQVQWHERALRVLHELTRQHTGLGEYERAIDFCNRLLVLDPWREEAHRQLMLLQARNGQRSAALAQYQACRSILQKEFGSQPSAETQALYERIQASMRAPRPALTANATGFVGRDNEIAELRRLLASPDHRLVSVLGPGGVGKTRLAIEVAAACETMFLNGIWFVSLADPAQPASSEQLTIALANHLGCLLSGSEDPAKQLVHFLRPKEMLLVLDNLEEWLETVAWLSDLLAHAPEIKFLCTSRQRLNLQVEQAFYVKGLTSPGSQDAHPERSAAWQLFVQRARRRQPDFSPDESDNLAIARICQSVEGLPLGIELAAAWVHQNSCAEIADQIESDLDFLTAHQRDVSPRHSSLRGVFAWSWNRLTKEERSAFGRLSVFSGAFDRKSAAEVTEASPAVLAALVDKSLVWRKGGLFQLHEVARQFGAEELRQAGEMEPTQARHAHYYAQLLASQSRLIQTADQQTVLTIIEREFENIISTWNWFVERRDIPGIAAAIDGLYHYTAIRSHFLQAVGLFRAARLALQPLIEADRSTLLVYCRVSAREGRFLSFLSRFEEANELLLACLEPLRQLEELDEMAFVLGHLGGTARIQGNLELAVQWLQEALDMRRKAGNLTGQAVALLELGGTAFMVADYKAGLDYCLEGLSIAEEAGDLQTTAHLLTGLSLCYRELGEYELALDYGCRAEEMYEKLGDRYGVIQAALTLGELNRQLKDYEAALRFCQQAVQISQEIGHPSGEADGRYRLGQVALLMDDLPQAKIHQLAALELAAAIQESPLVLDTLYEIAGLLFRSGLENEAALVLVWLRHQPDATSYRLNEITHTLSGCSPDSIALANLQAASQTREDIVALVRACFKDSP